MHSSSRLNRGVQRRSDRGRTLHVRRVLYHYAAWARTLRNRRTGACSHQNATEAPRATDLPLLANAGFGVGLRPRQWPSRGRPKVEGALLAEQRPPGCAAASARQSGPPTRGARRRSGGSAAPTPRRPSAYPPPLCVAPASPRRHYRRHTSHAHDCIGCNVAIRAVCRHRFTLARSAVGCARFRSNLRNEPGGDFGGA